MKGEKQTGVTRRAVVAGGAVALASGIPACAEVITETLTLRVTLTAEAKGQIYSNSTVITTQTRLVVGGSVSGAYKRHAPYVDLGSSGLLFLPDTANRHPQLGFRPLIHPAYRLKKDADKLKENERSIMSQPGIRPVDLDKYPTELDRHTPQKERGKLYIAYIYFPNRLEKAAARWKSRQQLGEQHGIIVKGLTFESVDLPITNVIETLLPWIRGREPKELLFRDTGRVPWDGPLTEGVAVAVYNLVGEL